VGGWEVRESGKVAPDSAHFRSIINGGCLQIPMPAGNVGMKKPYAWFRNLIVRINQYFKKNVLYHILWLILKIKLSIIKDTHFLFAEINCIIKTIFYRFYSIDCLFKNIPSNYKVGHP